MRIWLSFLEVYNDRIHDLLKVATSTEARRQHGKRMRSPVTSFVLQLACQDHAFLGVLGVTIICNFFCASPSPGLSSFTLTPDAAVVRLEPHAAAERDRE